MYYKMKGDDIQLCLALQLEPTLTFLTQQFSLQVTEKASPIGAQILNLCGKSLLENLCETALFNFL